MLATALGGRIAEQIIFTEITTGASNDLENATKIALRMIKQYGMSDKLGLRTFGRREELVFLGREIHEERDYSDSIAEAIDHEVQALIDTAHSRAREILRDHRDKLVEVANHLMQHETVEGEMVKRLFDGPPPPQEEQQAVPPQPQPSPSVPPTARPIPQPSPSPSMSIQHGSNPGDAGGDGISHGPEG